MAARRDGEAVVLAVSGDLDLDNVAPLSDALAEAREAETGPVVLDLSGITFADSTTVNVLLQGYSALGPRLRLARPSAFVRRLFSVIGLETALPLYETVEEALCTADTAPGADAAPARGAGGGAGAGAGRSEQPVVPDDGP